MSKTDTGGPAFPLHSEIRPAIDTEWCGMTLRDYFAAKATEQDIKEHEKSEGKEIVGKDTLGNEWKRVETIYYTREQAKYRYADAMLKERNNDQDQTIQLQTQRL